MKQIFSAFLILFAALTSCQKTETNPCEGLLNESPPTEIILKFIDKQSKETIVIDAAVIKVTEKQSGNSYTNWNVYNRPGSPVLNGALSIPVFSESDGEYQFEIQPGNFGAVILSYKIIREKTDNPCRPYSYPMKDIQITNQPFENLQLDGKTYPTILVVAL